MKNKNFIIVVVGQIISLFGNAIQRFCMSLYILDITGSAAVFSTILAISTIPYILFAPMAGLLADTINRKKIMVYLDFFTSALLGGYAILLASGRDHITVIGIVMFLLSIIYTLYGPSVTACIPQIVNKEELTSANGIIQQVGSVVNILGPIIAGILYSLVDIKIIVIINAVCFFISATLELFLEIPDLRRKENFKNPMMDSFKEMKRSFQYLKEKKTIVLGIIFSYALTNIFVVPILSIVSPFFVKVQMKMPSAIYGLVEAVFVTGMIVGGLFITFKPNTFRIQDIHKTMYPMMIGIIAMTIATYLSWDRGFILIIYAIGGLGIMLSLALSNVISLTYIQSEVQEEMLGKVSAFSTAVATASVAPGQLIYGQLLEFNLKLYYILGLTFILSIGVVKYIKWNVHRQKCI